MGVELVLGVVSVAKDLCMRRAWAGACASKDGRNDLATTDRAAYFFFSPLLQFTARFTHHGCEQAASFKATGDKDGKDKRECWEVLSFSYDQIDSAIHTSRKLPRRRSRLSERRALLRLSRTIYVLPLSFAFPLAHANFALYSIMINCTNTLRGSTILEARVKAQC